MSPSFCMAAMAANCSCARHAGIDAVQLPEVDALDAEAAHADEHLLAQILRLAAGHPPIGAGPQQAALGGDDEAFVGMSASRISRSLISGP